MIALSLADLEAAAVKSRAITDAARETCSGDRVETFCLLVGALVIAAGDLPQSANALRVAIVSLDRAHDIIQAREGAPAAPQTEPS